MNVSLDHSIRNMHTDEDITFNSINIGEHTCNVNRTESNVYLLTDFSDVIPKYSAEHGLYLELRDFGLVSLNKSVANKMLIENARTMSDDEYYSTYVAKKTPFVTYLNRANIC